MTIKIAINGFGRIGRCVVRAAKVRNLDVEFVAINDLTSPHTLAHLLKYDSVHGHFPGTVEATDTAIIIDGKEVPVSAHRDIDSLVSAWKDLDADIIFESTGVYRKLEPLQKMRDGTKAGRVLVSAPFGEADKTVVYGVNHTSINREQDRIISNASCTTNCLAPIVHVLHKEFNVVRGYMTTIHSYTNDQRVLDLPHKDLRRARAAALSMIPTTTGAAKAIGLVIPELKGKLDGIAVRVPTPNVSLVDLVATLDKEITTEDLHAAMKKYAEGELKGILRFCEEPLVSTDFNGETHSSIYDAQASAVLGGKSNMVKVLAWYDNEMGYAHRMLDVARYIVLGE